MKFIYGKNSWRNMEQGEENCYLLGNGLGGFSSLTVTGANARNDHALLMASVKAPVVRYHMISNIHACVVHDEGYDYLKYPGDWRGRGPLKDHVFDLSVQRYADRTKNQEGYQYLQSFVYEYLPQWQFKAADVAVTETVCLKYGTNTVIVRYDVDASSNGYLLLTPWMQFVEKGKKLQTTQTFEMDDEKIWSNHQTLYYQTNGTVVRTDTVYTDDWYYDQDARDGRDAIGCAASNHRIECRFVPGIQSFYVAYSMDALNQTDDAWAAREIQAETERQKTLEETSGLKDPVARVLARSANQYLTWRDSTKSMSVIAGFPFFGDWGRDTMIAMVGCTIATKQFESAKSILRTFMAYCHKGIMPNMFPGDDGEPMYNTADASLLFIEVVYLYCQASGDWAFLDEAWPVMQSIVYWYSHGTDYHIYMDDDGLICAGEGLEQLTWMDVRVGEILPTPRHGKPVEINAYWYNALKIMETLAPKMAAQFPEAAGRGTDDLWMQREADAEMAAALKAPMDYGKMAARTKHSFLRQFWDEERGCLRDVISGSKADHQIRCNQIWALTLSFVIPDRTQAQRILQTVFRHLYTPWGLRSLSPMDPEYHPLYGGSQYDRDMAYHQGTVWGYPLGAYYLAYLRWTDDPVSAVFRVRQQLTAMEACLREGCIGHIAEIYDGDCPNISRGCFAQAWSVGEMLRVYEKLETMKPEQIRRKRRFASKVFHDQYDYAGSDLGAHYSPKETAFKVWAPTASEVVLNLYACGSAAEAREAGTDDTPESYELQRDVQGTWLVHIKKDLEGVYYTYTVTTDQGTAETGDPYAIAAGVNGVRSMVVDMQRTNPAGWDNDQRPEGIVDQPVIYELHIQDFSHDARCGVRKAWRGKYLAFTEKGTTLDGAGVFPTCLDYIKSLGVNYVHLLPTCDYGSVDEDAPAREQFNWGYDPMNYNVPEGSYATDARDGHVRIREFKTMVQALHQAGLGVIMDVVYNHTYNMDTCLNRMVPDYYYRMHEDGTYANGSACGNDTASERMMFRRYMADSVCFWAREYHIDGFRFDLMGLHDTETMNYIRARLNALEGGAHIIVYGEPWSAAKTAWENGAIAAVTEKIQLLDAKVAAFCDRTRDAVKGSVMEKLERGYVNGRDHEVGAWARDIRSAVCAWCGQGRDEGKMMPNAPSQVISYVSSHDDLTLWDKLVVSMKEVPDYHEKYTDVLQANKMAAGIIFTSLGIPFFLAGEEYGRTKMGCDNSFDRSPVLNQLDWQRASDYDELVGYYRFLIHLRKNLPLLNRRDEKAADLMTFQDREDAVVAYMMTEEGKYWQRALIYYNPYSDAVTVELPEGSWQLISDGVDAHNETGVSAVEKTLSLKPKTVTILGIRAESEKQKAQIREFEADA